MVLRLTQARGGMPSERISPLLAALEEERSALLAGFDRDAASYEGILAALRLPRGTDAEQATRREVLEAATREATVIPLEHAHRCLRVLEVCRQGAEEGLPQAVSDAGVGAVLAHAGLTGALYNVQINLAGLADREFAADTVRQAAALEAAGREAFAAADRRTRQAVSDST